MTDAAPRTSTSLSLILAVLALGVALAAGGLYLWDRQQKSTETTAMMIDQLRRIDQRLGKIESETAAPDMAALNEKLDAAVLRLAEIKAESSGNISQQLQIIIEHQIKLQNDLSEIKTARAEMREAEVAQAGLKEQQAALANDLQAIAPALITAPPANDVWSKLAGRFARWVTVKPQASAAADITTQNGKVSRALYDMQQGNVEAALAVLPDDPRLAAFRAHAHDYLKAKAEAAAPKPAPETSPVMQLESMPPLPPSSDEETP